MRLGVSKMGQRIVQGVVGAMGTKQVAVDMDGLHALVGEVVREVLAELSDDTDPDAGLEFKPEVAEYLRRFLGERPEGISVENVIRELGLNV
jgi:hypothetical protein